MSGRSRGYNRKTYLSRISGRVSADRRINRLASTLSLLTKNNKKCVNMARSKACNADGSELVRLSLGVLCALQVAMVRRREMTRDVFSRKFLAYCRHRRTIQILPRFEQKSCEKTCSKTERKAHLFQLIHLTTLYRRTDDFKRRPQLKHVTASVL